MFHTHPALLQTLTDDHYRRLRDHHHDGIALHDLPSRATLKDARRAQRRGGV